MKAQGLTALLSLVLLTGCVSAMGQREAVDRASRGLQSYCRTKVCGSSHLLKTQKLKDRWLVDFESPRALFTVAVDKSGTTNVSVWEKNSGR